MGPNLAGKLLIAMPSIGDPRFEKSVILMCAHDAQHAMGLIVNKPRESLTVGDVLEHLNLAAGADAAARAVLDGGPVQPDRGYVLHSEDFATTPGTQDVAEGIRLTATREVLEALSSPTPPARFALALGYAGWGAGQVEHELAQNAWLVCDCDEALVFGEAHEAKWAASIRKIGVDPAMLSSAVGRA